ncbi:hypothetical protein Q8O96_06575 [Pseudomonas sp. LPH60]|uniref:hypothetical protein n=1 Tax=Pseudomonas sp. LPH60 TaxID=3065906 RepID=UPI00273AF118|nr:hypothetical protein [Pseudomonas sp. LPH60]MDP4568705.1 hypothetical protein [Pseudomonas sp. LPH60]
MIFIGCLLEGETVLILGDLKPYRLPIFLGVLALMALAALVRHLLNQCKVQQE